MYSSLYGSLYVSLIFLLINKGCLGATFTLINKCDYVVWPGTLAGGGSPKLDSTGFELQPGSSKSFQAGPGWSGRFWGRTGCIFDPITGQGSCATADCGSNTIECNGKGAIPPATLAEFTLGSGQSSGSGSSLDFYDVSLVDGFNLPMAIEAEGGLGLGACQSTGCVTDLNSICPNELRAANGQACRSACEAFGTPEYCCSGAYGSPDTCKPSSYSMIFKQACPTSYSYAYDDKTSTFTCSGADYMITFCPSSTSVKPGLPAPPAMASPNGTAPPMTGGTPYKSIPPFWMPGDLALGHSASGTTMSNFALQLTLFAIFSDSLFFSAISIFLSRLGLTSLVV